MDLYAVAALRARARCGQAGGVASFAGLANTHGIQIHACDGPNDPAVAEWLAIQSIDVLVVNCGHIVGPNCLAAVRLGVVNLHESLLPAHAGVFPYLYATVAGDPPGLTAHKVDRGIDTGPILAQRRLPHPLGRSLVGFQAVVAEAYGSVLVEGLAALRADRVVAPDHGLAASYHGLPETADVTRFETVGGRLVSGRDIIRQARLYRRRTDQ